MNENITATDLLRSVLRDVENHGANGLAALRDSLHPEARSAWRILRRTLKAKPGATHARYTGRGGFTADEPQLFIVAVDSEHRTHQLGPWDAATRGNLKLNGAFGSPLVDQAKAELAPDARLLRIVNHAGITIAFSPSTFAGTVLPPRPLPEKETGIHG